MGDNKLSKDTDISKADGVIKQSVLSAFSIKNPKKYLNAVTPFFSLTSSPIFSTPPKVGGATPLPIPPTQPYMAEGYVAEGYV